MSAFAGLFGGIVLGSLFGAFMSKVGQIEYDARHETASHNIVGPAYDMKLTLMRKDNRQHSLSQYVIPVSVTTGDRVTVERYPVAVEMLLAAQGLRLIRPQDESKFFIHHEGFTESLSDFVKALKSCTTQDLVERPPRRIALGGGLMSADDTRLVKDEVSGKTLVMATTKDDRILLWKPPYIFVVPLDDDSRVPWGRSRYHMALRSML